MAETVDTIDVAVIGGGPAGLAAATELRSLGVGRVVVFERAAEAGGVPRGCGHSPFGFREFRRPMFGPAYANALVARALAAGVEIRTATTVTALAEGPVLGVSSDAGVTEVGARAVLIATGVRESTRAMRLLGGTKPGGVMGAGALQTLVYGKGLRPFRRPVILGTELVAFSALLTCRHAGIRPAAMIEPGDRVTAWRTAAILPRLMRVPLRFNTRLVSIEGAERVSSVLVESPDGIDRIEADGVVVTGQFRPESALLPAAGIVLDPGTHGPMVDECGRCSLPGVYAVGNVLHPVETAGWCWSEARAVARSVARDLERGTRRSGSQIRLTGDALKYVVPQVISGDPAPALPRLQLRFARATRGELSLPAGGGNVTRLRLSALPERRVLAPLPRVAGSAEITFREQN